MSKSRAIRWLNGLCSVGTRIPKFTKDLLINDCNPTSQELVDANSRWRNLLRHDVENELAIMCLAENALKSADTTTCAFWIARLKGLSESPCAQQVHELEARLSIALGDHEAALAHWVAAGDTDAYAMFMMGNRFLAVNDIKSARACLHAAGKQVASSDLGRLMKAKCFVHEQRWTDAISVLEDLDSFDERRKLAVDLLYRCYMNDFRHDSAAILCESLDPETHFDKSYLLGKAQYKQHRFGEALTSFNLAINMSNHPDSQVWLIRTLYAINEHDSATARAELVDSMDGINSLTSGRCWEAAGMIGEAEKHYLRAAEADNDSLQWEALVSFYYNYRLWGRAYATIVRARKLGIRTENMRRTAIILERAFIATGTPLPVTKKRLKSFEFYSSEAMITAIVDRLLKRITPARARVATPSRATVALVINSLGPGGAERQAVNLANGLVKDEQENVHVLCTYLSRLDQDCFYLPEIDERVQVAEYYDRNNTIDASDIPELAPFADLIEHIQPASRQQLILHMAKRLIELDPDVVHGWLDETLINTALVCGMLGIERVVGRWGSMPPGVSRTVTERDQSNIDYLQHAYRNIARLPNLRYTSNSRLTGDAYAALLGIDPVQVSIVYNGIDEQKLIRDSNETHDLRAELGIPENALVVGTVFRISEEKRPLLWIEVAAKILQENPEMHFVIVGAGPLECQLVDRIREEKLSNVHMVGKQTNVGAWFDLFDIFLLTSRVEGVSNAVVEAQFSGCPVIAPDVGGLSEAMANGATGYLLDDHSVQAFANAVLRLGDNPSHLAAFGKDAQIFVRRKFSVPTMVMRYRYLFYAPNLLEVVPETLTACNKSILQKTDAPSALHSCAFVDRI